MKNRLAKIRNTVRTAPYALMALASGAMAQTTTDPVQQMQDAATDGLQNVAGAVIAIGLVSITIALAYAAWRNTKKPVNKV